MISSSYFLLVLLFLLSNLSQRCGSYHVQLNFLLGHCLQLYCTIAQLILIEGKLIHKMLLNLFEVLVFLLDFYHLGG